MAIELTIRTCLNSVCYVEKQYILTNPRLTDSQNSIYDVLKNRKEKWLLVFIVPFALIFIVDEVPKLASSAQELFLNTLNDDSFDKTIPDSLSGGLPVGGNIN